MSKILIQKLLDKMKQYKADKVNIMEVCGTHTQSIAEYSITSLIPHQIKLLSGPGCPVCVTPKIFIDNAIKLLLKEHIILTTFGDMMRVRGSSENLDEQRIKGKKALIVYSPFDIIEIAKNNPSKLIIFLSVGFETTAPIIASMVRVLEENKIKNIKFLTSLKLMPPILKEVLKRHNNLSGILCPGHVATVMGEEYFRFITDEFHIPSVICGFDAIDIISGIYLIMEIINGRQIKKYNNIYKKYVFTRGNLKAKSLMGEVFEVEGGFWRGIGFIENSALVFNEKYRKYDAAVEFKLDDTIDNANLECDCGNILLGNKSPLECKMFGKICSPHNPKGPCMVSSEGACSVYYRYRR